MVEEIKQRQNFMTNLEINTRLKRKLVRIKLGKREYCFRILRVREIINRMVNLLEINKGLKGYKNVVGLINYDECLIPVIDFRNSSESVLSHAYENCLIIVIDVIVNGFILQFGIMVNNMSEILYSVINGISEDNICDRA